MRINYAVERQGHVGGIRVLPVASAGDVFLAELLGLHLHGTAVFRSSRISRAFPASAWTETGSLSAKNSSMAFSNCARAIANGLSFIKTF